MWILMEKQCLQGLETWCQNLVIFKFWGRPIFQWGPQYSQITTIKMYLLNENKHNIYKQCHLDCVQVKKDQLYS